MRWKMGQEIKNAHFNDRDFKVFNNRLDQEYQLLNQWFNDNYFDQEHFVAGFELEAWLVDDQFQPTCGNEALIHQVGADTLSPELACFNFEYNFTPQPLKNSALSDFSRELLQIWQKTRKTAEDLQQKTVLIGILPTVADAHLHMDNISGMNRYQALNEQVLRLRQGMPLTLDIHGHEKLRVEHHDVMLESVTTSFQIHFQVPLSMAARTYNASVLVSAPMVAISANSPYLFGKDLWDETRIPVFEQAVESGGFDHASRGPIKRVTFGSGYIRDSIQECFRENLEHYPVLLPTLMKEPLTHLAHLRLHNGTIWRWNRPLVGIEHHNGKHRPHIRIEHRVVPAGPSLPDTVANAAFYYGLVYQLINREIKPELQMPFDIARDNFYQAAKFGLDSHITWLDSNKVPLRSLVLKELLPMAVKGLQMLNINQEDIDLYMSIIEQRVKNQCNGTAWQRAFVAKYGKDMSALTRAYYERQNSGEPVHTWDI